MHLLGLEVTDASGVTLGQVVDTYPFDGGGELEMIVLRLRRFGERRMLPVSDLRLEYGRLVARSRAGRSRTRRTCSGRHLTRTRGARSRTGTAKSPRSSGQSAHL